MDLTCHLTNKHSVMMGCNRDVMGIIFATETGNQVKLNNSMLGLCLFEHIETSVGLAELIMTPPWRPCMVVGVMIPQRTPFFQAGGLFMIQPEGCFLNKVTQQ